MRLRSSNRTNRSSDVAFDLNGRTFHGSLLSMNESEETADIKVNGRNPKTGEPKTRIYTVPFSNVDVINESSVNDKLNRLNNRTKNRTATDSVNENASALGDVAFNVRGKRLVGTLLSVNESDIATIKVHSALNEGKDEKVSTIYRVPTAKVDILNEASVLDTLKAGAQKIGSAISRGASNLFSGVKKMFGTLISFINGKAVDSNGPVNIAINQTNGTLPESVTFFADKATVEVAQEQSMNVTIPQNEPKADDPDDSSVQAIENFWMNVINNAKGDTANNSVDAELDSEAVAESFKETKNARLKYLYESDQINVTEYYKKLNEAVVSKTSADILYADPDSNIPDVSFSDLTTLVYNSYKAVRMYSKAIYEAYQNAIDNGQTYIDFKKAVDRIKYIDRAAIMIWGAPGIGKTQIVNQLINAFNTQGGNRYACHDLDALHMQPDDFTLPALQKKVVVDDDGNKQEQVIGATDVVKDWLPMARFTGDPVVDLEAIKIADGPSKGGFIFIDEFSRMNPAVAQIFMNIIQDQKLQDRILGPSWMIICAGNRKEDMQSKEFIWDSAWDSRFTQVNYVPDIKQWLAWARNAGLNSYIVDWIASPEGQKFWYENLTPQQRKSTRLKSEPRSLELAARAIDRRADSNDVEELLSPEQLKALGIKKTDMEDISDLYDIVAGKVGVRAADSFREWMISNANFSVNQAADVIQKGPDALSESMMKKIQKDVQMKMTLESYVKTIMDATKELNDGKLRALTNEETLNVYRFLDKLTYRESSKTKNPAMFLNAVEQINQMYVTLLNMIPVKSDDNDEVDPSKYLVDYVFSPEMSTHAYQDAILLEEDSDYTCAELVDLYNTFEENYPGVPVPIIMPSDTQFTMSKAKKAIADTVNSKDFALYTAKDTNKAVLNVIDPDHFATDYLINYRINNSKDNILDWIESLKTDMDNLNAARTEKAKK